MRCGKLELTLTNTMPTHIGGHSQCTAPTNLMVFFIDFSPNKRVKLFYITSSCWLKIMKKPSILVGAIHWLCPPICVGKE